MRASDQDLSGLGGDIFEGYPSPTLLVDRDVRVLLANRAARAVLGMEGTALPRFLRHGGDVLHCLHAEGPGGCGEQQVCEDCVVRGAVGRALSTGSVQRSRATLSVRRDGQIADLNVLVSASAIAHGGERRVVVTIDDVTDVVHLAEEVDRAEQALRATEARLATVFENLFEGVVVASMDGEVLHWNPAALAMHGFRSEEECRRRLPEFADTFLLADAEGRTIPVEEWPLARVLRGETLRDLEVRVRRIDEERERVWLYRGSLVRNAQGQPLMATITVSDVTDRKLRDEALRESERQLSLVLEGSNDGYWDFDLERRRNAFSPRCFDIVGERPAAGESLMKWWWGRVHPEEVPVVRGALDAHLSGQVDRIDISFRLRSADGAWRWVRAVGRVVKRDGDGRPIRLAGTVRDITERRAEQDQLRAALAGNEKLVADLQMALGRVRTLSGLLPMCAWCKRIRNDEGYWAQIESYISANSEAKVSHGMCPDCFAHMWKDG